MRSISMIDRIYEEHKTLVDFLTVSREPSLVNSVEENFRKTLLLSSASYFETQIREILMEFISQKSSNNDVLISFVRSKAISRQYHTYFSWEQRNANTFFGLMGSGFKEYMKKAVSSSSKLENAIKSFLELGQLRNLLVHEDYAAYTLEKTTLEIFTLYQSAIFFIEKLPEFLSLYPEEVEGL